MWKKIIATVKTFRVAEIVSFMASIGTLGFFYFSFYFQYYRENHSMKVSATAEFNNVQNTKSVISVHGVLVNYGNRTEVLYSSELFVFSEYPSGTEVIKDNLYSSKIDLLVVKPGEAASFVFKDTIKSPMAQFTNERERFMFLNNLYLKAYIHFITVSPTWTYYHVKYDLGSFQYRNIFFTDFPTSTFTTDSTVLDWQELIAKNKNIVETSMKIKPGSIYKDNPGNKSGHTW